jgi:hypothetical protein
LGNLSSAGKTPPSYGVPSGPWIMASHRKRSSSLTGPAVMPSGGSVVRCLYSWNSRLEATEFMLVVVAGCEKMNLQISVVWFRFPSRLLVLLFCRRMRACAGDFILPYMVFGLSRRLSGRSLQRLSLHTNSRPYELLSSGIASKIDMHTAERSYL